MFLTWSYTTSAAGGAAGAGTATEQRVVSRAKAVRYAQSMAIVITLQEGTNDGKIYPPLLRITYGVARESDYEAETKVEVGASYSQRFSKISYSSSKKKKYENPNGPLFTWVLSYLDQ